jgi:hypothetical protein
MNFGVRVSRFCIYQSHVTGEVFMTDICVVVPLKLRLHKLALVNNGSGKSQQEYLLTNAHINTSKVERPGFFSQSLFLSIFLLLQISNGY